MGVRTLRTKSHPLALATVLISMLSMACSQTPSRPMNAILVIAPYKYHGSWVFDDPSVGLNKEPFIAGIDTMIDCLVADIPNAEKGFRAFFSAHAFPGHEVKLEKRRSESGGTWYYCSQYQMEGWLCPALFKYFETAPQEIYVKAEPLK